jgi:pimeloyl-ACP methyl ester carboxylesterase
VDGVVSRGWFRASDGARLAWYEGGRPDGPPIVFLSGLGGGFGIFQPLIRRFGAHCRLIGWDYRGLYASERSRRGTRPSMTRHVRDLLALLAHARVEAPILIGWSMGVQLGLELHRAHAKLPRALVGIHGTCGRPFDTAFDSRWSAVLAPRVLSLLAKLPREGTARFGPRLARAPGVARGFTWLSRGLGLMAPEVDVAAFRAVAEEWTQLDFAAYAETFDWLARHDASDLLPKVATPTLLVAGGRDPLTPSHLARGMVSVMPDAELCLIPEATHFGLIEAPDRIAAHVADFLRRRLALNV